MSITQLSVLAHRGLPLFLALALASLSGCKPTSPQPEAGDGQITDQTDDTGAGDDNATSDDDAVGDAGSDGSSDDTNPPELTSGIIADHTAATAFASIPAAFLTTAQATYRLFYGHTSHGSQIVTGLSMIEAADERYAFNAGAGTLSITETDGDLGTAGDLAWVGTTRAALDEPGNNINMVMWSWCGGVSENSAGGIDAYLAALSELETDYPNVIFVYMTGHLDGTGPSENLYARNNQIRDYCGAHDKVLFDFADIESYDPDGNYYPDGSDWCEWCATWCASHNCPACGDCAHSQCINCYQKGRAFWWLLARLAGWAGTGQ